VAVVVVVVVVEGAEDGHPVGGGGDLPFCFIFIEFNEIN
jgi:hypothetical protein